MIRALAALALLAVLPATASAQIRKLDEYQRVVYAQFRALGEETDLGEMTHEIYMGSLDEDAKMSLTVPLDAGTEYFIVGACDGDCTDLDLTLFSGTRELDEDIEDDDTPIVQVTPTSDATFRIEVSMAACSSDPCRFGIAIFEKD